MQEGWYLMSVRDLEIELAALRDLGRGAESNAIRLSVTEAIEFRDRGNLPDDSGRSLRLVLTVDDEALSTKRLRYEPDYHAEPSWRREGSKPINVVPIPSRHPRPQRDAARAAEWWEQPDVVELESEWQRTGFVRGLRVPGEYRSFVLKTIASLESAGIGINVETVTASMARWLSPEQVSEIREALTEANG